MRMRVVRWRRAGAVAVGRGRAIAATATRTRRWISRWTAPRAAGARGLSGRRGWRGWVSNVHVALALPLGQALEPRLVHLAQETGVDVGHGQRQDALDLQGGKTRIMIV